MNRFLAILLLCPLAAFAAEWQYDGQMAAGGEMATTEPAAEEAGVSVAAGPAPPGAPTNNMTMTAVRAAQGEPDSMLDAVGDPPITRWQYPEYVVYFEYDRVIISVAGHW